MDTKYDEEYEDKSSSEIECEDSDIVDESRSKEVHDEESESQDGRDGELSSKDEKESGAESVKRKDGI